MGIHSLLTTAKSALAIALMVLITTLCLTVCQVQAQNVGINSTGAAPHASSMLDIASTNRGALIPRMTTPERDSIAISCSCTPAEGLQVFNTTTHCLEFFVGGVWQTIACGCGGPPTSPTATSATAISSNKFTAHWNTAATASGYLLDVSTASDFSSFVSGDSALNVGNVLSYSVTGLTATTTYYYRVRSINNCGASSNSNTVDTTTSVPFPSTGLIAYWKMDETNGNNPIDATGNNHTLSNNNGVAFDAGLINNSADFGSSNPNQYFSSTSDFSISSTYSVSMWVKLNTEISSGDYGLIEMDGAINTAQAISIYYAYNSGSPQIGFTRLRSCVNFDNITVPITLGTSQWHHLAATYDGATVTGYIDGVSVGTVSSLGNGTCAYGSTYMTLAADFNINYNVATDLPPLKMDEVGIWNTALSSTDITNLYNSGNGLAYPF